MTSQLITSQAVPSKGLSKQSKKHKTVYLECCEDEDDLKIVESVFSNDPLKSVLTGKPEDIRRVKKALVEKIGMWRVYLGCTKDVGPKLLQIEADYILDNWGNLTIDECDMAFKLFLHQKLPMNYPNFINFAPLLISQVFIAYIAYRKELYIKLNEKAGKKLQEHIIVTPEDRVANMQECIKICYDQLMMGTGYTIISTVVWDYLWATKKLRLDEAEIEAAKQYADKKEKEEKLKKEKDLEGQQIKEFMMAEEHRKKLYSREYCLLNFFKNNNVEQIMSAVSIEEVKQNIEA